MKDKKTFGLFIKQKRIDKNYSQKELAHLLFVTESAVSKWERGVTYPDITLISDICRVLEVTEKELIEASNDTEYREMKSDANKYNKLKKTLFWFLTICYITAILSCFIVNLAVEASLSWFFIVLSSSLCGFTFCPTFTWISKKYKLPIFIGSSIIGLFILFLTLSIFNNNYWFMIATMGVLLGYFIIFYPILFVKQKNYTDEENYKKISKTFLLTYSMGILILLILLLVFINIYSPFNIVLGLIISVGCLIIPIIFGVLICFGVDKKIIKIPLFTLLTLIIILVLWSLIESINLTSNTKITTYVIEETFDSIQIDSKTYDISIYQTSDSENKILCSENDKNKFDFNVVNGTLIINQIDEEFYSFIDFGINLKLDLYLTVEAIESLTINQSTGDIYLETNVLSDLKIEVSTGDILIKNTSIGRKVTVDGGTSNVNLENVSCDELVINVGTGDTKLSNTRVTNDFNFTSSTGDLIFDSFDAKNIYVESSTGSVTGTIISRKIFYCTSKTGNVSVPETYEGGICKITLSTGSINISYK